MKLTLDDLKKAKALIGEYKQPKLPEYKKSILEKIMNKLKWYRQTTVYLIDLEKFKYPYIFDRDILGKEK